MLIYFLRHGETPWNREARLQGATPYTDLTDFGVHLAELTRDGFAAQGIRFDRAYTSPLRRAVHTAEIVLRGQDCPLVADARLREMGFGRYEGSQIRDGFWEDDNVRTLFQDPANYHPPAEAETFEAVSARVSDFLENELSPLEGSCRNILAVSHGGFMRSLLLILRKTPLGDYWKGRQPNCCVHIVLLEKGVFSLVRQSAVFYDAELAKTVPSA